MFIGHAAVALAAKPLAPRANLGVALAAAYWLDLVWPVLVLAGIALYLRHGGRAGAAFWALIGFFVLAYLGAAFGPPPPNASAVAASALALWLLPAWGWWIGKP